MESTVIGFVTTVIKDIILKIQRRTLCPSFSIGK